MIELNTEYTYKIICEKLGWTYHSANNDAKKKQIKCIEESFEFYHPENNKTHKPKKSYIFTKQIKEPILIDNRGGSREGAGRKTLFSEEEFDYLWKVMVIEGCRLNKYYDRSWINRIYFTNSLLFDMFGFNYNQYMSRVEFDENEEVVNKTFQDIVYQTLKSNTVTKLCKRYCFEKNSIPKGILRSYSKNEKKKMIDDDDLLPKYEEYLKEELKLLGFNTVIEAINNNKYLVICENIEKRFRKKEKKYNVKRMNVIQVDDIDVSKLDHFGDETLIREYRHHFREIIFSSVEKSCMNRIEDTQGKYKKKLNKKQKELLKTYLYSMLGKEEIAPVVEVKEEQYESLLIDMSWLNLVS